MNELKRPCSYCGAGVDEPCRSAKTPGKPTSAMHNARLHAASSVFDRPPGNVYVVPEGAFDEGTSMTTDSFTCPKCGATSCNPNDVREGYCGRCHDWTGDATP